MDASVTRNDRMQQKDIFKCEFDLNVEAIEFVKINILERSVIRQDIADIIGNVTLESSVFKC